MLPKGETALAAGRGATPRPPSAACRRFPRWRPGYRPAVIKHGGKTVYPQADVRQVGAGGLVLAMLVKASCSALKSRWWMVSAGMPVDASGTGGGSAGGSMSEG